MNKIKIKIWNLKFAFYLFYHGFISYSMKTNFTHHELPIQILSPQSSEFQKINIIFSSK